MSAIGKTVMSLLLLALMAAMPLACLNINNQPDDRPRQSKKDVNVGGDYGVDVKRSDEGTKVKIGGYRGVVVDRTHDQTADTQP